MRYSNALFALCGGVALAAAIWGIEPLLFMSIAAVPLLAVAAVPRER